MGDDALKLRTISFNVHMWYTADGSKLNITEVGDLILSLDPDIVALQEVWHDDGGLSQRFRRESVSVNGNSSGRLFDEFDWYQTEGKTGRQPLEILAQRLEMEFVFAESTQGYGNALLWRCDRSIFAFSIRVLDPVPLPPNKWGEDRGLQTRMLHGIVLEPTDNSKAESSTLEASRGKLGPGSFAVLCTHLDHTNEDVRLFQLAAALRFCDEALSDKPHLILGDFNALVRRDYTDSRWSTDVVGARRRGNWEAPRTEVTETLEKRGYVDVLGEHFSCREATCAFRTRIDFLWASPNLPWKAVAGKSLSSGFNCSDHALLTCSWHL